MLFVQIISVHRLRTLSRLGLAPVKRRMYAYDCQDQIVVCSDLRTAIKKTLVIRCLCPSGVRGGPEAEVRTCAGQGLAEPGHHGRKAVHNCGGHQSSTGYPVQVGVIRACRKK